MQVEIKIQMVDFYDDNERETMLIVIASFY